VTLNIPANARNGQKLRLRGRGLPGQPSGDQLVVLRIVNPPVDTEAARELFQRMERELPFDPRAHWQLETIDQRLDFFTDEFRYTQRFPEHALSTAGGCWR
jgi:DnaJ-class molecular chaperone